MAKKIEIPKMEGSSKKPMINSERPILKTGEYKCCGKEWIKRGITNGQKFECNTCNRNIGPQNQITWNKRWYGYFRCTEMKCKNKWTSSNTWTVDNKIQTTQCKACFTSTLPYEIVSKSPDGTRLSILTGCMLHTVSTINYAFYLAPVNEKR